MNKQYKIKTGLINFTNCLPFNFSIEREKPENIELVYGTPAELNKLMSEGSIDVAPISSFEYLMNRDNYTLIKTACISSDGECGSVILFSKAGFRELNNCKIGLPADSASSAAMLKVILNEYDNDLKSIIFEPHNYEQTPDQFLNSGFKAVLFIGDNALKNNLAFNKVFLAFDIGKLWKDLTGYPAVFGTWAARNSWMEKNRDNFEKINNLIPKAIETGLGLYFNRILNHASGKLCLNQELIRDYLTKKIRYNYTERHEKSLELFKELYSRLQKSKKLHFVKI